MDEQMIQAAAMEQMLGGGGGPPGGGPMGDPFASDAPPGYTMVYVPDSVLPAVMELVEQGDMGGPGMGGGMGAPGMAAPSPAPAAPMF
jgi:hypothetical protein